MRHVPLIREDQLQNYSNQFLCQLYSRAQGINERLFNRYEIFNALGLQGFSDAEGTRQATDEIVQNLMIQGFIGGIENSEEIRLTIHGLVEARRICADMSV
jgi:hypothetical protein